MEGKNISFPIKCKMCCNGNKFHLTVHKLTYLQMENIL